MDEWFQHTKSALKNSGSGRVSCKSDLTGHCLVLYVSVKITLLGQMLQYQIETVGDKSVDSQNAQSLVACVSQTVDVLQSFMNSSKGQYRAACMYKQLYSASLVIDVMRNLPFESDVHLKIAECAEEFKRALEMYTTVGHGTFSSECDVVMDAGVGTSD
jgi:hypothetical protein